MAIDELKAILSLRLGGKLASEFTYTHMITAQMSLEHLHQAFLVFNSSVVDPPVRPMAGFTDTGAVCYG